MNAGARAMVEYFAELLAAAELERQPEGAEKIDRTRNAEENPARAIAEQDA